MPLPPTLLALACVLPARLFYVVGSIDPSGATGLGSTKQDGGGNRR